MNIEWVRVGDVLELQRRLVEPELDRDYVEIGVRSFGRGLFLKEPISGAEIGSKRVFAIEPNDLVVSNIFAWEGAVAVAGDEVAGTVGSHRFMTWTTTQDHVHVPFVAHFFASEAGLELLRAASPGSAGRNRTLSIKNLQDIKIPLPPIDEQRRIAAHLDAVDRHSRVPPNRRAPEVERALLSALFDSDAHTRELGDLATVTRGVTPILQSGGPGIVGQASVRWDGIDAARLKGVDASWESSRGPERRTQVGDLLLNSTGEGTIGRCGLVDSESVGLLTDSKVLTVRVGTEVLADYLALYLRSPYGQAAIEAVKGANTTKQTELGVQRALRLRVPDPSKEEQRRVVSAWAAAAVPLEKFDRAERHRSELISSLLPAARIEIFSAMR
ncbi:hypothetical protein ASJ30_02230 [Janibacter indicus]|uniref:Type I restriction modification DNA specificity domain-containing protein n=1 Tax=Janibacter indicus TaxID=857417 RepID=A0A1L3MDV1_9MICO|nr:hypothetical protein ASJ30_02230 [Janibacter indicus]